MLGKRIEWVDAAKGIGIILVVLGHTLISPSLVRYIFSFHMPLFFFISGYLFSIDKYPKFMNYLKNKIRSLIIPYVSFSIISVFAFSVIVEANIDITDIIKTFVISKRNDIFYNVPLWFFTSLFLVQIIYYLFQRILKKDVLLLFVSIIFCAIAISVFKTIEQPKLPWTLDAVMYYMLFYCLGNIISRNNILNNSPTKYLVFSISILLNLVLLLIPSKLNFIFDLIAHYRFLEVIWYPLMGISGIFTIIFISNFVKGSRLLGFLGKNSLIVFSLHVPFGLCVIDKLMLIFNFNSPQAYNVLGGLQTAFILLLLRPLINFINKYFGFILGKNMKNNHYS